LSHNNETPQLQTDSEGGIINDNQNVIGDEVDGGNSEVYNNSERSWGEGSNTESGIGTLQEHDGGSNREVQSNGNFGRNSQVFSNQGNNRRIEPTSKQKKYSPKNMVKNRKRYW
jgi:hypothetical protein